MSYLEYAKIAMIVLNMIALIAMIFAHRALTVALSELAVARSELDKAFLAIESVSSSRASRLAADSASRAACRSSNNALASLPTSSSCCARTRTIVSPIDSNAAR